MRALEDAVLLGGREPSVQREHLGRGGVLRVHAANRIHRIPDLRLARQEHEHVAGRLAVELPQGAGESVDVVRLVV